MMIRGGLVGGCIAYGIKVGLTTALLGVFLIVAIMLRFDITLDYVLHESDPAIEAELASFLDLSKIKSEIIDALPIDFVKGLSELDFLKDILAVKETIETDAADSQKELFKGIAFGLFSFLIVQILFFAYRYIKKLADLFSKGLFSLLGSIFSFLQIAYIVPIIAILLRDLMIERFYAESPLLMYIVYVVMILAIFFLERILNAFQGIRHKENFCNGVGELVRDALFAACCLWVSLSVSTAITLNNNGDFSADVIANVVASIAITILVCAFRYKKTVFPSL